MKYWWIILIILFVTVIYMSREKLIEIWDDHWTDKRIKTLHPAIRDNVYKFINEAAKKGYFLRVTDALRSFDEQDELYKQGRSKGGKIVTNAKGGESLHNFGLAFDVVEMVDGVPAYDNPDWNKIANIGKKYGFDWGGDWNFVDKPHFERDFGLSINSLQQRLYDDNTINGYVNLS